MFILPKKIELLIFIENNVYLPLENFGESPMVRVVPVYGVGSINAL
jgi:hypothetical protein